MQKEKESKLKRLERLQSDMEHNIESMSDDDFDSLLAEVEALMEEVFITKH